MSCRAHGPIAATALAALAGLAPAARAERPTYAAGTELLAHDGELGHVRVHYVTDSDDAVPLDDADEDAVPDYVEEVAALAEIAWEDLEARGFRPPLTDAGVVPGDDGGDGRFDIYLRDLIASDGNYVAEECVGDPIHCAGFFAMENDLAGFGYPSITEGLSVLTSHELFHAVQNAYAPDTTFAWSEGTAVWNEEQTFPEQSDYERLVAAFLARPYRPFDRSGGGFGDAYPYGTALWPTFLDERYGDGTVLRSWEACEEAGPEPDFLDAIEAVLAEEGTTLESAWTEFSRWNLFTGERADPDRAYQGGADLDLVATEPDLVGLGSASTTIEGLSARYLPVVLAADQEEPARLAVEVDDGAVAAFFPLDVDGAVAGEEIELARDDDDGLLTATLPARARGIVVVTGVSRGGLPRDANVELAIAPPDEGDDDEGGGCQAARSDGGRVPGTALPFLAAAALLWPRLRRHPRRARGAR
jgi:hypothetical protein